MKRPLLVASVALAVVLSQGLYSLGVSAELPALNDVQVRAAVKQSVSGVFTYSYSITNPPGNMGQIVGFAVEITKPAGGADVGNEGIASGPRFIEILAPRILAELAQKGIAIIPVGLFSPENWFSGLTTDGRADWGSEDEPFRIKPVETLSGFEITSRGLPSIRQTKVDPGIPEELLANEDAPPEEIAQVEARNENLSFHGRTLGPTAPPAVVVPLNFLASLVDLKHQAEALGWVGGPKFVAKLDKKLDQAREKLTKNNLKAARGKLKAFIEKVEAQFKETKEHDVEQVREPGKGKAKDREDKKFVTSEGRALLVFNAAFLRDRLPLPKDKQEQTEEDAAEREPDD